ncbi:hypothetical protein HBI56_031960 [Parastagonospora nodorum]|uniref:Secreted protein n=1 Tax=Phaeosphaeria nodorum (strain SN15 / ATCC MYA-4574 / FGSC 10173) TaxID=321614 RepID=A0A7U2I0Z3_PHANO|nr:hypothetical protein HBH56_019670 [Parastagonospora nodorum]QRC95367.1 hypothetical protein JI435_302270 [Parastagonospora nodorum SN15]KAH3936989.1 hypothetical protein HBH54_014830 [Parastagonospora nodorum]KAH3953509.1 hypothetical protein HBH53_026980 [Parastagonospora nodorum]KAH3962661.1 hypothetical protein HBH51_174820 [Parastagonospora nodorum]
MVLRSLVGFVLVHEAGGTATTHCTFLIGATSSLPQVSQSTSNSNSTFPLFLPEVVTASNQSRRRVYMAPLPRIHECTTPCDTALSTAQEVKPLPSVFHSASTSLLINSPVLDP